jgi:hypothetical protein
LQPWLQILVESNYLEFHSTYCNSPHLSGVSKPYLQKTPYKYSFCSSSESFLQDDVCHTLFSQWHDKFAVNLTNGIVSEA